MKTSYFNKPFFSCSHLLEGTQNVTETTRHASGPTTSYLLNLGNRDRFAFSPGVQVGRCDGNAHVSAGSLPVLLLYGQDEQNFRK